MRPLRLEKLVNPRGQGLPTGASGETLEGVADRLGQSGPAPAFRRNLALLAEVTAHWAILAKAGWEGADCLDLAMLLDAAKEALGPRAQAASWIWWKAPCSAPFW